jgi:hypothetical protein
VVLTEGYNECPVANDTSFIWTNLPGIQSFWYTPYHF